MKKIIGFIDKHKKYIILTVIVSFLITISVLLSSYAYLTWQAKTKPVFAMTIGEIADVSFTSGNNISGTLYPVLNYTDGLSTSFSIINKDNNTGNYKIDLNINYISPELANSSLKYAIVKDNVLVYDGNFEGAVSKSTIELYVSSLTPGTSNYILYIYIDGNIENNSNMANKTFTGSIVVKGVAPSLSQTIKLLYNNAPYKNDNVVNNGITYHYRSDKSDLSSGLMNDGFSASERVNPDSGNIRYYGTSPNNYINLPTKAGGKDKYRIIGLFKDVELANGTTKDLVKVIRNDSIGNYSWDTSESPVNDGYGINQWGPSVYTNGNSYEGSDLMRLLNPGYSGVNGSLWWDGTSGYCYTSENNVNSACNFASTGLDSSIKNKIANVVWHMGILNSLNIYTNDLYIMEREEGKITSSSDDIVRTSTWTGKVALMSASDYRYAVNFNNCTDYCQIDNWLKNSDYQWISSSISSNYYVWRIVSSGSIRDDYACYDYGVRPVFYLSSELSVASGDGSSSAPYEIG